MTENRDKNQLHHIAELAKLRVFQMIPGKYTRGGWQSAYPDLLEQARQAVGTIPTDSAKLSSWLEQVKVFEEILREEVRGRLKEKREEQNRREFEEKQRRLDQERQRAEEERVRKEELQKLEDERSERVRQESREREEERKARLSLQLPAMQELIEAIKVFRLEVTWEELSRAQEMEKFGLLSKRDLATIETAPREAPLHDNPDFDIGREWEKVESSFIPSVAYVEKDCFKQKSGRRHWWKDSRRNKYKRRRWTRTKISY